MKLVKSVLSASILAAAAQTAVAIEINPYAQINVAYNDKSYNGGSGFEDTSSRVGVNISEDLNGLAVVYNYESSIDPTNETDTDMSEPDTRINALRVSGNFGTVSIGKDWVPFYNAIGWGVGADRFNGYYSGFEMVTGLRQKDTLFYTSPNIDGLQLSASISDQNNDRKDIALTYKVNDQITLAAAFADGDTDAEKDSGVGISYTKDSLMVNLNYMETDDSNADYTNLYTEYALDDKNTLRAHISDTSSSTNPYTLGFSHQYNDNLNVYVEYYDDETTERPQIGFSYSL